MPPGHPSVFHSQAHKNVPLISSGPPPSEHTVFAQREAPRENVMYVHRGPHVASAPEGVFFSKSSQPYGGLSLSLGQQKPGQIRFTLRHQQGNESITPAQFAFSIPTPRGMGQPARLTYSFSQGAANPSLAQTEPISVKHSYAGDQPDVQQLGKPGMHGHSRSWEDSKTVPVRVTYPLPSHRNTMQQQQQQPLPSQQHYIMAGTGQERRGSPIVRSLSPPTALPSYSQTIQVNRAHSPVHRPYNPPLLNAPPPSRQHPASPTQPMYHDERSMPVQLMPMNVQQSAMHRPQQLSPIPGQGTAPGGMDSRQWAHPLSPVGVGGMAPANSRPAAMMTTVHQPARPQMTMPTAAPMAVARQSQQAPLGPPGPVGPALDPGIGEGLFALFDKSVKNKFLQWEGSQSELTQSETYKLVQEMDEDEKRYGSS